MSSSCLLIAFLSSQAEAAQTQAPPPCAVVVEHWGGVVNQPLVDVKMDNMSQTRKLHVVALLGMVPDPALMAPTEAWVQQVRRSKSPTWKILVVSRL